MRIPVRTVAGLAVLAATSALSLPALAQSAGSSTLARNLAATCANCHGTNGQAVGDMKPLAGTPAARTVALMTFYKTNAKPEGVTIMHQIAKGYTDEQIKLIADYLAAQPAKK
jgi:cytochrome c553